MFNLYYLTVSKKNYIIEQKIIIANTTHVGIFHTN